MQMPAIFSQSLLLLLSLIAVAVPSPAIAEKLVFAVTDVAGLEELQREFGAFQKLLSEKSGVEVALFPVTSRTAAAEAMRAKRVDLVLTGPGEYVVLRKRTNATPLVALARSDYFSAIIVMAKSGIHAVADLKGKKVAFGDIGSTSYHLAPLQLLKESGLSSTEITPIFVSKQIGFESLKRGDVAAIGMNHERFTQYRAKDPTRSALDYRVIARSRDLPPDVIAVGGHVPAETQQKLRKAIIENSDALIAAVLTGERNNKYEGMRFVESISDADYNYIREMYRTAGYPEYSEFIGE